MNGGGTGSAERERVGQRGMPGHRSVGGQQTGVVCQSLPGKRHLLVGPNQFGVHQTAVADGQKENEGGDRGEITAGLCHAGLQEPVAYDGQDGTRGRLDGKGYRVRGSDGRTTANLGGS